MKLRYPADTIGAARLVAEGQGHTIAGRFTRVRSGLSWETACRQCGAPVVVTPGWAPWETDQTFGAAVAYPCSTYGH